MLQMKDKELSPSSPPSTQKGTPNTSSIFKLNK